MQGCIWCPSHHLFIGVSSFFPNYRFFDILSSFFSVRHFSVLILLLVKRYFSNIFLLCFIPRLISEINLFIFSGTFSASRLTLKQISGKQCFQSFSIFLLLLFVICFTFCFTSFSFF